MFTPQETSDFVLQLATKYEFPPAVVQGLLNCLRASGGTAVQFNHAE